MHAGELGDAGGEGNLSQIEQLTNPRVPNPILRRNARHLKRLETFLTWISGDWLNLGTPFRIEPDRGCRSAHSAGVERARAAFDRAWPIEQAPRFDDLLRAIDEAERKPKSAG